MAACVCRGMLTFPITLTNMNKMGASCISWEKGESSEGRQEEGRRRRGWEIYRNRRKKEAVEEGQDGGTKKELVVQHAKWREKSR